MIVRVHTRFFVAASDSADHTGHRVMALSRSDIGTLGATHEEKQVATRVRLKRLTVAVLALIVLPLLAAPPLEGQPRPVEGVSVRAELSIEEMVRTVDRGGWTMRHNGPWLYTNDQWTNAAGVSYFPANTEYWVVVVIDECASCEFQLLFFDEDADGYFSMDQILSRESDGSLVTASGRFEVGEDTRGELYLQMSGGGDLYKTYVILAQIR